MILLTNILAYINSAMNMVASFLLAPAVRTLPGWLSNTIISAVTGVLLMAIFKYTSNQSAIGRARDGIKANMLALKLFKDSMAVTLQSQGRLFKGAILLLVFAIVPMMVMMVPVCLLLGQMGQWYQSTPLNSGQEAMVVMQLNNGGEPGWPDISIEPTDSAEITMGPIRVLSKRQVYWKIKAGQKNGYHNIVFNVDGRQYKKELAVGDGFMRTSTMRPGLHFADVLINPWEKPFAPDSAVQSISIDYPDRISKTSGTDWWVIYFFVASMVFALLFKPILKVRI